MIKVIKKDNTEEEIKKQVSLLADPVLAEANRIRNIMSPRNKDHNIQAKAENFKIKEQLNAGLIKRYKNTGLFTREQIIKECIKFNLLFVKSKTFRGEFSLKLVSEIQSFLKENELIVSEDAFRTDLFILGEADFKSKSGDEPYIKETQKDPLVFFEIEEKGEIFYILIGGSTKYKTLTNVIKGYIYYSRLNSRFLFTACTMLILTLLYLLIDIKGAFKDGYLWTFAYFLIPSVLGGIFLNTLLYKWDGDSPLEILRSTELKSNKIFFGSKFSYKSDGRVFENLTALCIVLTILYSVWNITANLILRDKGSITEVYEEHNNLNEREIKENNLVFDPKMKFSSKEITQKVYTPGIIFYNKDVKIISKQTYTTPY